MTRQSNGWQARAIRNANDARRARNQLIRKLRAERVNGDEHTPAELEAIHAGLKADYYAREAQRRTAA